MRFWPSSGSLREPSSSARHAEHRRVGRRLAGELARDRSLVAGDGDEVRHPGAPARSLVRLVDGPGRGQRVLAVRQHRGQWRLVCDERAHVVRVRRHERQGVDGAAAAGEEVDRPGSDGLDESMQVVGVLRGRRLRAGSSFVGRSDPRGS